MTNPLKIVIITYNIYPRQTPRSFRSTQLAVELAKQGHDVTVYAILGKKYNYHSFCKRTNIKVKDLGINTLGCIASDGTQFYNNNLTKMLKYMFGRLLSFPSVGLFPNILRAIKSESDIDYLITIAVPYVNHWAPSFLSNRNFKVWASDCGDPFMGNPFIKQPKYFSFLEKRWGSKTDCIVIPIEEAREAYYSEFSEKIRVIPQGFNFEDTPISQYVKNKIPTFAYAGNVYNKFRDPSNFLEYLSSIKEPFIFYVYTKSPGLFNLYKERLKGKMQINSFIDRAELLKKMSKMDFLINIKNNDSVQQPSKLIDYYITKRPILEISSNFSEKEKLNLNAFFKRDFSNAIIIEDIEQYKIQNVASRFLDIYNEMINKKHE